jgi:LysR family transcriptional regulator, nod-box dependent transcriptional activator
MRFKGLDLNLLVVFDALMQTRSVSGTGKRLNLSQPGISSALKRLREHFGDEIFASNGKRMFPTAYAESLYPHVIATLHAVDALLATSTGFNPAESQRTFRLSSSDFMATAVFAPLARQLAVEAPGVKLELLLNDAASFNELASGSVDFVCVPEEYVPTGATSELLFEEKHVVIGWRENPVMRGGTITTAEYFASPHAKVAIGHERTSVFSDRVVDKMAQQRNVDIIASSFTILPSLLIETRRLALMHERLAKFFAKWYPLAVVPIPFEFPLMREMLLLNPVRQNDPGLSWLRKKIHSIASSHSETSGRAIAKTNGC